MTEPLPTDPELPDSEPIRADRRRRPTRVAVVVVPGVGDDGPNGTVDTLTHALVRNGHFDWAEHDEVTVTAQRPPLSADEALVATPADSYSAARRRVGRRRRSRYPEVRADLYEMSWADLSRFPSGLARFVFSLFGLVLQLGRSGIEAARGLDPAAARLVAGDDDRPGAFPGLLIPALRRVMCWLSWWLAFVVVPLTAAVGVLGFVLWAVTVVPDAEIARWAVVAGGGLALVYVALKIGRGVASSGWGGVTEVGDHRPGGDRTGRRKDDRLGRVKPGASIAKIAAVLGVSLVVGWFTGNLGRGGFGDGLVAAHNLKHLGDPTGIANLLLGTVAWPLRIAWLAAVTLAAIGILLAVAIVVTRWREGGRAPEARSAQWRVAFTSLLSVTIAPFLLAFVAGLLLAAGGFSGANGLGDRTWDRAPCELRSLAGPNDWTPAARDCGPATAAGLGEESAAPTTPAAVARDDARQEQLVDEATAAQVLPRDWLNRLVAQILEPAGLAAVILLVLVVPRIIVAIVIAIWLMFRRFLTRGGPLERLLRRWAGVGVLIFSVLLGKGRPGGGDRRTLEGQALNGTLRRLEGRLSIVLLAVAGLAGVAGTFATWGTPIRRLDSWASSVVDALRQGWVDAVLELGTDSFLADWLGELQDREIAELVALGVPALLLLARLIPFSPVSPGAAVGGWLERLRTVLDIGYDVASYVRSGDTAARLAVATRYRALLIRLTQIVHADGEVGYRSVIFVAHSQGTIYTAATLFGDMDRDPPVYRLTDPLVGSDANRAATALRQMESVSFFSFGSPIRQTYDRRFPGQYAAWYLSSADQLDQKRKDLAPLNDTWLNMYRPADYVGREVNHVAPSDDMSPENRLRLSLAPGTVGVTPADVRIDGDRHGQLAFVECCLDVPGAHVGYFGLPVIAATLNFLIDRAAGHDPAWPGPPQAAAVPAAEDGG